MLFINDKCWILFLSGIYLTRAFNVYVVPDQEDLDEDTEFPTEEIPTSTEDLSDFADVTMDSGEYTTYIFQYENEQNMGLDMDNPKEICFDDFTKCLSSLISGVSPVCAFNSQYTHWTYNIRTFRSTCDMQMDNCFRGHRHWRMVDLGKCKLLSDYQCSTNGWNWGCFWYKLWFNADNTK